jgi:hypothetical protein
MFASIKAIAFAVIGTDFLYRLFVLNGDFPSAIMWLGSDSTTTGDIKRKWMIGSLINVLELFTFLFIINMLDTSDLDTMREFGIVRNITIISCCGLFCTCMFFMMTTKSWFQDLDSEQLRYSQVQKDKIQEEVENSVWEILHSV